MFAKVHESLTRYQYGLFAWGLKMVKKMVKKKIDKESSNKYYRSILTKLLKLRRVKGVNF